MKQTKIFLALQSLSKVELKSLQRYLIMETSRQSEALLLLKYINTCIKNNNLSISKDKLREDLFPGMAVKRFLNLCSKLYLILEDWLVWYDIKKDKDFCNVHLVKIFNRRGIFELADKAYNRADKILKQHTEVDLNKSEHLSNLYRYHYFSENPVKFNQGKEFLENLVLYSARSYLEKSHLYLTELHNWGKVRNFDYSTSIKFLEESIQELPVSNASNITHHIYSMVVNKDQESINYLYSKLEDSTIKKGSDLETFVTLYIVSCSIYLWSKNKLTNTDMVTKIHDYGLSAGIFMNLGKISSFKFLNIISVLVLTSRPQEVYDFIDKWSHILEPKTKQETTSIAQCYVKREEGKYDEILDILRETRLSRTNTNMLGLIFQIKALYKLKEYELAQNAVNNFKRRLRNMKDKDDLKSYKGRYNFLRVMDQLIKKEHSDQVIDLSKYESLYHRIWLSKQL